jgi:hypothetical protein
LGDAEHGSEVFEDFLSSLGDRINMKGWDKYRGDFSNKGTRHHHSYIYFAG